MHPDLNILRTIFLSRGLKLLENRVYDLFIVLLLCLAK